MLQCLLLCLHHSGYWNCIVTQTELEAYTQFAKLVALLLIPQHVPVSRLSYGD